MATANPVEVSEREDNFELELERVRENVKVHLWHYLNV